jgi:hypothetical protein
MKKKCKNSRIDDLMVDVVEYAFTEWLVRQGVFSAFKANYEVYFLPSKSFRDRLRAHIQFSLCDSNLGLKALISSAFLYTSTPEGAKFWRKQSDTWKRFCSKLEANL